MRRHPKAFAVRSTLVDGSGARSLGNPWLFLATLAVASLLLLSLASSAAALSRVSLGSFGNNTGPDGGAIRGGKGLAVNRTGAGGATVGDVYVGDASNNRVQQFSASGDFIRTWGAGVVPGAATGTANLTSVSGTGTLAAGSQQVTAVTGSFTVGQAISGAGIPTETTISSVGSGALTLSKAATASGSGVALTAGEVTSVVATSKAFVPGQPVTGSGIPAGTKIATVTTGVGAASKLTLSNAVTATATNVSLVVSESPENVTSNEQQTVAVPAAATGSYKLKFKAISPTVEAETAPILVGASAAEVEAALTALANVGPGNVSVTEPTSRTYLVEFRGKFADTNVEQLTIPAGGQPTGGTVTVTSQQGGQAFEICTVSCTFGTASAVAGGMSAPSGLSVDQQTGNVYVVDASNRRIDVFGANGAFQGAFGWGVNAEAPAPALQFCTAATGCSAAAPANEAAGAFSSFQNGIATSAVDPTDGDLYVSDLGNVRVNEFQLTHNLSGAVTGVSFVRAIGWDVIPLGQPGDTGTQLEQCTTATTCKKGLPGNGESQFSAAGPAAIAVDSQGDLYVVNLASGTPSASCSGAAPCRVLKFDSSGSFVETFGPHAGESSDDRCQVNYTAGVQSAGAAFEIAVDPSNDHVYLLKGTGAGTYRVYEFDEEGGKSKPASEKCEISPPPAAAALLSGGLFNTRGLAVGSGERLYVQNTSISTGRIIILGPAPPPDVEMVSADATGPNSATLVGEVTPPDEIEGQGFETSYRFEYSTSNSPNPAAWTRTPVPDGSAGSQPVTQTEEAEITGLHANTPYFARICATTAATVCSDTLEFTTGTAAPTVVLTYPEDVGQTEATLGAHISPNNLPSTYHFEWADEEEWEAAPGAYGRRIPAHERQIGRGPESEVVIVGDTLTGLSPASVYHFRVVATNGATPGTTFGPDQRVETLNSCGLVDDRCFELVSPPDKRPQGEVRAQIGSFVSFQAAPDGNSMLFPHLGAPQSDAGGDTNWKATRTEGGWGSTKVSPASLMAAPTSGILGNASPGGVAYASEDLECLVVNTFNPLTADTPDAHVELGLQSLYRRNPDGTHTLITSNVPSNPEISPFLPNGFPIGAVVGASPDCSRIYFESPYDYLGDASGLYEWDDGVLRDAGRLPDGSRPSMGAGPGGERGKALNEGLPTGTRRYAVSSDGSRLFFNALSNEPATAGKEAIFMREAGVVTEVSKRQGGTTDSRGSEYALASPDGSHVFFLSTYGLTPTSSIGPKESCVLREFSELAACDLYDYDVEQETLTNLSATTDSANSKGAVVQGMIGSSEDGSVVYFVARGQLVPGKGNTYAENVSGSALNLYRSDEGQRRYVATVAAEDLAGLVLKGVPGFTAQVTPSGDHLLFLSRAILTGYDSGGVEQAYLYSAQADEIACISCRRDQRPSLGAPANMLTPPFVSAFSFQQNARSMTDDGSRVFFTARDVLARGAVPNEDNLYEWSRGQVSLLATGRPDTGFAGNATALRGTTPSGDDVFLTTPKQLDAHDIDFVQDIYDVRVGGGFAPPVPPAPSCDVAADECQAPSAPQSPAPTPSSAGFSGPGNPPAAKKAQKKSKKKGKKKHRKQRKNSKKGKSRANTDRGGAK